MNILVVAAHPDDEILGCGAVINRFASKGDDVCCLILGEGITSRASSRDQANINDLSKLKDCCRKAATIVGIKKIFFADFPDNRFDTVALLDIVKKIEETIVIVNPEIVFTQHGGDLNIDHSITYRATLTATRPLAGTNVKAVYAYEVPSSTEWSFQKLSPAFRANSFFMVTADNLDSKIAAMAAYENEKRLFPHPRSSENIEALAKHWGSVAGVCLAEAFELVREIRCL